MRTFKTMNKHKTDKKEKEKKYMRKGIKGYLQFKSDCFLMYIQSALVIVWDDQDVTNK